MNSPKQLSELLFEKLGLPTKGVKKTKTGYSTNAATLELLQHEHPLPELLLEYRGLHKLKSTYVDVLPRLVSKKTGRLHSHFHQTVTATGRLSSSDPNLQNIPIQSKEGRRIRQGFIADEGKVLVAADYSQIELRVLAHLSGDASLQDSFRENEDIHARTSREILGFGDDEEVSSEERRIGKTINFGIVYGMSGFRLSRELEIPVSEANRYIENYFARYPRVKELFERLEEQIEKQGYVETLFGRKRFKADIDASGRDKGFALRALLNAPFQGTAADIIKLAMIQVQKNLTEAKLPASLLLQIHDELVLECSKEAEQEVATLLQDTMEGVVELDVPLVAEVKIGKNWEEAH